MSAASYYAMKRAGTAAEPKRVGNLTTFPEFEQGSDEWFDARRGLVTASVVGKLITVGPPAASSVACPSCNARPEFPCVSAARKEPTPIKSLHDARVTAAASRPPVYEVANNETSRGLTSTLIAERIAGWTESGPTTWDMIRGVETEPYARDFYSAHYQQAECVGFMRLDADDWSLGFSPDGQVGTDGLVEFKAPRARTHLNTILSGEVPAHYVPQCQAGLLVSGRKWCDFVSFVGGLPVFVKRVYPDPDWFAVIEAACRAFEVRATEVVAEYREKVRDLPPTIRIDLNTVELKLA